MEWLKWLKFLSFIVFLSAILHSGSQGNGMIDFAPFYKTHAIIDFRKAQFIKLYRIISIYKVTNQSYMTGGSEWLRTPWQSR